MCGIVAIYSYSDEAKTAGRAELLLIRDRMISRGPDDAGEWFSDDKRIGMGHRRLSIIDLSKNGAQPMKMPENGLVIVFNGEIYNYRELRRELEMKGCHFRSTSDTEVLLHLYAEKGAEMLHDLRGMYAFAIWDEKKKGLFLARDPFGIKPLYFADNGKTLRVASQVKALLAGGRVDTSPEPAGHVGFFLWGFVPEPFTLYKGVRSLPAVTSLWISSNGDRQFRTFCSLTQELRHAEQQAEPDASGIHELLRDTLADTVRHHLIADVPVGSFLSSGLDSATLTGLASEFAPGRLHTVTLGFREYQATANDEVPLAERVARAYGTSHSTVWIEKETFDADLEHMLDAMDQPSIDGVNSYFVCKAAVQAGLKVAISGLGGDELFGSYPSFHQIPRLVKYSRPFSAFPGLGRGFRLMSAPIMNYLTSPKYAGILEYGGSFEGAYLLRRGMYMPWELPKVLDGEMVKSGWNDLQTLVQLKKTVDDIARDHLKVSALEMGWYMRSQLLRDADWASMAHSLEVRTPLVDLVVLRRLAPILGTGKSVNKQFLSTIPRKTLPHEIIMHPKTGFSIPVRAWLQDRVHARQETSMRSWSKLLYPRVFQQGESDATHVFVHRRPAILVYSVGQLGDSLVAMPAIRAIKKRFPMHRMVLLTNKQEDGNGSVSSWDVFGPTGWFDEVVFYRVSSAFKEKVGNILKLSRELRGIKPEHVFDLSPDRTVKQFKRDHFFFSKIVGAANYHGAGPSKRFQIHEHKQRPDFMPEWKRLLSIATDKKTVGDLDTGHLFELPIPENTVLEAKSLLELNGISENAVLLAIGPGSKMPAKRWPIECFRELGKKVLGINGNVHLIVLGGSEDTIIGKTLCGAWGERTYNFAGQLSVFGSAAVLKRCRAYVGNDTGTMHLAGMTGIPCVAIFSARDYSGIWEPYGSNHTILRKKIECAGCMSETCPHDNDCLKQISVNEVFEATKGLLRL